MKMSEKYCEERDHVFALQRLEGEDLYFEEGEHLNTGEGVLRCQKCLALYFGQDLSLKGWVQRDGVWIS